MKKRWKRVLALALSVLLAVSNLPTTVMAEEADAEDVVSTSGDVEVSVEGTNDVAELIATALTTTAEEQDSEENYITDLTVDGMSASVLYWIEDSSVEADVVVAVYEESSGQMTASGSATVSSDENIAEVELEGTIPEYFVVKAFLLEPDTHQPIAAEFTSELYTQEMQEFLNTTVADYDADLVVNLDEDDTSNFLVFGEDIILIHEEDSTGVVADNEDGSYTVTNADETFTSLKAGDTIAYSYTDETLLIIRVDAIIISGSTVTIQEDDSAELTDIFEYIKIETDSADTEAQFDDSEMDDEYITYEGMGDISPEAAISVASWGEYESEAEATKIVNYSVSCVLDSTATAGEKAADGETEVKLSIKGSLKLELAAKVEMYASLEKQYFAITFDYALTADVAVEGSASKDFELGNLLLFSAYGVNIKLKLTFCTEISASVKASLTISGSVVQIYDSTVDSENIRDASTKPTITYQTEMEGKLFIGLKTSLGVECISEYIAGLSVSFKTGGEVTMKEISDITANVEPASVHTCNTCYEGEINLVVTAPSSSLKMLGGIVSLSQKLGDDKKLKLMDFYYSEDYDEWGFFSECPYKEYRVTLTVADEDGETVAGAVIYGTDLDEEIVTDKNGEAVFYLPSGEYYVEVISGAKTAGKGFKVGTNAKDITATLGKVYLEGESEIEEEYGVLDSGTCGDNVEWVLYNDGSLYIKGMGMMTSWKSEKYVPWYNYADTITRLIMGSSITSIGDNAFYRCTNMTEATIGQDVVSLGEYAFGRCGSLTEITIPDSVESLGDHAFYYCSGLTKIVIPDTVLSMGSYCFSNCTGLTDVTIGNGITEIEDDTFLWCTALTEITIPDSVTSIGEWAVAQCKALTEVTIGNSVTEIGGSCFYNCSSLVKVSLSESLEFIGSGAFDGADAVSTVYYSGTGEDWFAINFADQYSTPCRTGVDFYIATDSGYAIMTEVEIPAGTSEIGIASFYGCKGLERVTIPDSVTSIAEYAFCKCTGITGITFPDGMASIGYCAFAGCTGLLGIEIPDSVTNLGECAFLDNTSLVTAVVGESVTDLPTGAFSGCSSLRNVTLGDNMTRIGSSSFDNCDSLESFVIPSCVKEVDSSAFYGCASLSSIYIPVSLTSIGTYCFTGSDNLKDIYYEGSEEDWSNISIGSYAFSKIDLWTTIDVTIHYNYAAASTDTQNLEVVERLTETAEVSDTSYTSDAERTEISAESEEAATVHISCCDVSLMAASDSTETALAAEYGDLAAGESYVFLVVRDANAENLLSTANLLYIDQAEADANGTVAFSYVPLESVSDAALLLYGPTGKSITDAEITLESDTYEYTGMHIKPIATVVYEGTKLEEDVDYTVAYSNNFEKGTGTVRIKGYNEYSGVVTKTFTISKMSQIVTTDWDGEMSLVYGEKCSINAFTNGDGEFYYESDDTSVVTVDETGCVTAQGQGTAMITVTVSETDNYIAGSTEIEVAVERASQTIVVSSDTVSLTVGETLAPVVTGAMSTLSYSSSEKSVVSVSSTGKITALKAGTAYITITAIETAQYASATATVKVNVREELTEAEETTTAAIEETTAAATTTKKSQTLTVSKSTTTLAAGKTWTPTVSGAKTTLSYKSADTSIATVNASTGKIKAVKAGTVKITVTAAATTAYSKATATITVKVTPKATSSLKLTNTSSGIKLTWKKVTGATGYYIYRSTSKSGTYKKIATVKSGSTVTYTNKTSGTYKVTNGKTYYYKVIAYASTGKGTASSVKTTVRLTGVTLSSVKNSASKKMTVKWKKNSKATGYQIQYSTSSSFASGNKTVSVSKAATVSKTIGSLKKGKTYYVRIRAYKTVSGTKYYSAWSAKKKVKISK